MKESSRQRLKSLFKFLLAAGLIWFLVRRGMLDFSQLQVLLRPQYLLPIILLYGCNLFFCHWRWVVLLNSRGFGVGLFEAMPLTLIGVFFNYALPGSVGGDVVKGYYLVRQNPARKLDAATSVLMDRLLGLYVMILLASMAVWFQWSFVSSDRALRWTGTLVMLLLLGTSLVAGIALLLPERAFSGLRKFGKIHGLILALMAYGSNRKAIIVSLVLSAAAQLVAVFFMIYVGQILGYTEVPLGAYFFAVPLGFMLSSIPISPAGIGVGQVAFLSLFQLYTKTGSSVGPLVVTAYQGAQLVFGFIGAYFYLTRNRSLKSGPIRAES